MKPQIHILGCGGAAGIGMTRCLANDDRWEVTGWDDAPWARKLAECELTQDHSGADLILPVPDSLVRLWAGRPHTALPDAQTIHRCQEKELTAKILGDLAPPTLWVRDTHGAGGAGAQKLTGQMASEYLPGRNLSCEMLYWDGHLEATFQKERLSYRVGSVEPNVTGIGTSAVSRCIDDSNVLEVCKWAMRLIDQKPHGVYAIDLKEDQFGEPKITEINPGRFLTASYVYYAQTGYNLPKALAELALFGRAWMPLPDYPEGIAIVRQIDSHPWVGRLPRHDHENEAELVADEMSSAQLQ